jgi:dTDP-glucose 4,6-dehydratase
VKISDFKRRILITGGAGFIGSSLLRFLVPKYPDYLFVNIDCLTYAGNLGNLASISNSANYLLEKVSIVDEAELKRCFDNYLPDGLIHLAAETHVDRSIESPSGFVATNVTGTYNLLERSRQSANTRPFRFHHISTDEVFGSLPDGCCATEESPYRPNSPYAASKAASDHLVRAFHVTYGLDTVTSHSSNNYGPYQYPEKLIPLIIRNGLERLPLPIYGDGRYCRDWLYVEDHCTAIDTLFHDAPTGSVYNVSAGAQIENIDLVRSICAIMDSRLGGEPREKLIRFVQDRPGHDRRYALDSGKIQSELGWRPQTPTEAGLSNTVDWYLANHEWLKSCLSGEYLQYYDRMYRGR